MTVRQRIRAKRPIEIGHNAARDGVKYLLRDRIFINIILNGPIKTGGFDEADKDLDGKVGYSDWQFVYTPPTATGAQSPKPQVLRNK